MISCTFLKILGIQLLTVTGDLFAAASAPSGQFYSNMKLSLYVVFVEAEFLLPAECLLLMGLGGVTCRFAYNLFSCHSLTKNRPLEPDAKNPQNVPIWLPTGRGCSVGSPRVILLRTMIVCVFPLTI